MAIAALAAIALTLVGCDGVPSTPLPEGTVAVVAGLPITYAEFLATREQIVHNAQWMKREIEPESELSGGLVRNEFVRESRPSSVTVSTQLRWRRSSATTRCGLRQSLQAMRSRTRKLQNT